MKLECDCRSISARSPTNPNDWPTPGVSFYWINRCSEISEVLHAVLLASSHCRASMNNSWPTGAFSFTLTLTTPDARKDHVIFFWRQSLADHPSVEKRYRQSVKRRTRNIEIKSRLRTLMKKARQAIEANHQEVASSQIQGVNKALGKSVSKGIVKKNTASRWLSRLARSAHRSKSAS